MNLSLALTGVAQWFGHCPTKQKVTGSIPGQGTCIGYRPGPGWGVCMGDATHQCVSLSHSPSFPLSLKINNIL